VSGRRRIAAIAALLACALACGGEAPPAAFRVALLTPGSIRDEGWNQRAYEALERIRSELGAEVAHQETHTPQEFESGFRDFAARGFSLVFGHGFEFQDAAAKVAGEFPGTVFVTTSGNTIRQNVAPIVFELEQATYVLGVAGAELSRRGRMGMLGGKEIPSVASTFLAFEEGAKSARPQIQLARSWVGSWEDVAAAREATLALIQGGADVLIHNADAAAGGFFEAVKESPDVIAFGANADQAQRAPQNVLASATLDIARALLLVSAEVKNGKFWARSIRYGLKDDVVGIAWNPALESRVSPELRAKLDGIVADIRSGRFRVPRAEF